MKVDTSNLVTPEQLGEAVRSMAQTIVDTAIVSARVPVGGSGGQDTYLPR
jgi:hypothetical protein